MTPLDFTLSCAKADAIVTNFMRWSSVGSGSLTTVTDA